jgi:Fibronectin type III domain/Bacterial Ig domain
VATTFVSILLTALIGAGTVVGTSPGPGAADTATSAASGRAAPVTVHGVLERLVVETAGGEQVRYAVRAAAGSWWLEDLPENAPAPGSVVEVTGTPIDDYTLTVARMRVVAAGSLATAAVTPRSTKVLVLRVFWGARPPARPTTAETRQRVIGASRAWFREVSHGRYTVSGTVARWLRIPRPGDCYQGSFRAAEHALAAATRAGYRVGTYGRVILYLPCNLGGLAGYALMPGGFVWLFGNLLEGVVMHEQGHNLGLPHASSRTCRTAGWGVTTWSSRCDVDEYGDQIDTMGNRRAGHYNAFFKSQLGWLRRSTTVRSTRTVRLTPYAANGGGLKAARIKAGGATYWLEYRTRTGADGELSRGTEGVQIRLQRPDGRTELLDAAPGSTSGHYDEFDVHLSAGSSWTTPQNVRITVTGQTRSTATVSIRFGARPRAPGTVGKVTARAGVGAVSLAWRRPPDNGSIIRRYEITRLNDGARRTLLTTGGTRTSYRWGGLKASHTYRFSVRAVSQAGSSASVRSPSVRTLDDRPTVAVTTPTNGATVRSVVPVRFTPRPNPHTRQSIQHAVVYVDGREAVSYWGPPWGPFQWDTRGLANGRHTIRVVVTDQASKSATATVNVNVNNPTPTVRITNPGDGDQVAGVVDVRYALSPTDWDWESVELLVDGSAAAWAAPGERLSWDTTWLEPGPHTLRVRARDARRSVSSSPVTVTIPSPTVAITSPSAGARFSGSVEVTYSLAPVGWDWQWVDLLVDGSTQSGAAPGEPLALDTAWFEPGPHTLQVRAYDSVRSFDSAGVPVTFTST